MSRKFKILFVTYGGGHVRMALPVAKRLANNPDYDVTYLGLTTAAQMILDSGIRLLRFSDLVIPDVDNEALKLGRELSKSVDNNLVPVSETIAYLGLSFSELIQDLGRNQALQQYDSIGRHAFRPVRVLRRAIERVMPDLVVITNSPRAEHAASLAANELNIPVLCLVDLFAIDEVKWIAGSSYAKAYCVLNDSVKEFLVDSGCKKDSIFVTGNPAFDRLLDSSLPLKAKKLRANKSCVDKFIILWPMVDEPNRNPFTGELGSSSNPAKALSEIVKFVLSREDVVLWVRPRPGASFSFPEKDSRLVVTDNSWNLSETLYAVNLVIAMNTTIAVEAYLTGAPVLKVLGSVFDRAMPLKKYGIAFKEVQIADIYDVLSESILTINRSTRAFENATEKVKLVVDRLVGLPQSPILLT